MQIFHVRATTKTDMRELRVRSASLDVLGVEVTRRPGDQAVEQCQCPPGYSGASCQLCAPGHYRDYTAYTCLSCPCHGHEDTCQQDAIQASVVMIGIRPIPIFQIVRTKYLVVITHYTFTILTIQIVRSKWNYSVFGIWSDFTIRDNTALGRGGLHLQQGLGGPVL